MSTEPDHRPDHRITIDKIFYIHDEINSIRPIDDLEKGYFYTLPGSNTEIPLDRRRTVGIGVSLSGEIIIAVAICSPRDNFSRKIGRNIVTGRINNQAKIHNSYFSMLNTDLGLLSARYEGKDPYEGHLVTVFSDKEEVDDITDDEMYDKFRGYLNIDYVLELVSQFEARNSHPTHQEV